MINLFDFEKQTENASGAIEDKDIAIIGLSVKLPLVDDIYDLRNILINKIDCIRELPERRKKDILEYLGTHTDEDQFRFQKCGYLEEIDGFDPEFFKITPLEAKLMNPIQRKALMAAYEALDNAGYGNNRIKGSNTGVFAGYLDLDGYKYKEMISQTENKDHIDISITGNLNSIIPGRIAYHLDLKGPCMVIDTACSSSLVAVHEACKAIRHGDCDQALVIACRLYILPIDDGMRLGMESENDCVRTFDDAADGTAKGEGVISYFLKPLNSAVSAKDYIYAVIKGSAINHDGATMGITAPNTKAQSDVMETAWKISGINPTEIECFEAHGTATKIGDVIELDAISKAFGKYTNRRQFCAISSVKSNIGHLYDAAGLAGLAKCIIQLQNKELLPGTNFRKPNQKIDFLNSPVYINDKYGKWNTANKKRLCALSSFGFSGTNCHMVLEEYAYDRKKQDKVMNSKVLALSARNRGLLLETVKGYKKYLTEDTGYRIDDICYTANIFKEQLRDRIVIIFNDIDRLLEVMGQMIKNNAIGERLIKINGNDTGDEFAGLDEMADLFLKGEMVDWNRLYDLYDVKKVPIPRTPMDIKRYWTDFNVVSQKTSERKTAKEVSYGYEDIVASIQQLGKELLGLENLEATQNLLDLGVDSIILSKFHKKINELYPGVVSLPKMFVYPTISQLANYICNEFQTGNSKKLQMGDGNGIGITGNDMEQLFKDFLKEDDGESEYTVNQILSELEKI